MSNSVNWHQAFLIALERTGSITQAAEAAGVGRWACYDNRRRDPVFAAEWDKAVDLAADALEDEARKRAFAGSDVLLMFMLKGLRPQRWRESRVSIPPAELNKLIEAGLRRLREAEEPASPSVN
jgi:hypothetical protein